MLKPTTRLRSGQQGIRLDADRRRTQASRDVMTVLDMLETSDTAAAVGLEEGRGLRVEGRAVGGRAAADQSGKQPTECGRVLVVLFVHNISPVETG